MFKNHGAFSQKPQEKVESNVLGSFERLSQVLGQVPLGTQICLE